MEQVKQFKVGKRYSMSSPCNQECVWTYEVVKRTACTVTLQQIGNDGKPRGEQIRCRINKTLTTFNRNNAEAVLPLGSFSMAPVLRAK